MPDLVSALRAELAAAEQQRDSWKALAQHPENAILTVVPDGENFRVAMTWNSDWQTGEFGVLLATVVKHVANNASLDETELLMAIDHALGHMEGNAVNGGRVQ